MASIPINNLNNQASIDGTELFPIVKDGKTYRTTISGVFYTNAVTTTAINNGAVTSLKVANSAITVDKINNGVVTPIKLSTGSPTWTTTGDVSVSRGLSAARIGITGSLSAANNLSAAYVILNKTPIATNHATTKSYVDTAIAATGTYEELRLWNNNNVTNDACSWCVLHNSPNWKSYKVFVKRVANTYSGVNYSNVPIGTYAECISYTDYLNNVIITPTAFVAFRNTSGNRTILYSNVQLNNLAYTTPGYINSTQTALDVTFLNTDWQMVVRIYS